MPHPITHALPHLAAQAAARGWHVFPLVPGVKIPAVRAWEQRATTDPQRIARCWAAGPYNLGIATGPSRLVVIDLDVPKRDGDVPPPALPSGVTCGGDALALLAEQHGRPYPCQTYTVRTPSGGMHLYFTAPAEGELRNTAGSLAWKVDTRAVGGYVVGAGSTIDGHPYEVVHDATPAPLPDWLATLLAPAPLPPQRPVTVPLTVATRQGRYLHAAVTAELERVHAAVQGQRNTSLYCASVALGQLAPGTN